MAEFIKTYKDLIVWQKSMDLVVLIYKLTDKFPTEEKYGLISQMRRCAVSIPSNIAEGRRRGSKLEFRRFLRIAFGSGGELETQLEIAKRLRLVKPDECEDADGVLLEVMKMLNTMSNNLSKK